MSAVSAEEKLFVKDGRLALVDDHPQRLIGFWFLTDVLRVAFIANKMQLFAHDRNGLDDGMYCFVCGSLQMLEKHYKLATKPVSFFFNQKAVLINYLIETVFYREIKFESSLNVHR